MPTRRRYNPGHADERHYARLAHAASLPLVPKAELAALSDADLKVFAEAYEQALFLLDDAIEEEEDPFPGKSVDEEYLAAARSVYATLRPYVEGTVAPLNNARRAHAYEQARAGKAARRQKAHEAKLRTAGRMAEEMAAQDASVGILVSKRASVRGYLGKDVRGPKGWYHITAVGDEENSLLRALLGQGTPDKRVHSGAWFLLEQQVPYGTPRDAFLISVNKK